MDYFMESLVSNLSPNASPLQSSSPVKGRRGQASTHRKTLQMSDPDLMDEGSVDIYGDILGDDGARTSQADEPRGSEGDKPRTSQGDEPRTSEADKQRTSQADKQRTNQADKQRTSQADKQRTNQADKQRTNQADIPRGSEDDKPRTSEGDKQRTSQGVKPRTSEGVKSSTSQGDKPRTCDGGKPRTSEGNKPRSNEGDKPRTSQGVPQQNKEEQPKVDRRATEDLNELETMKEKIQELTVLSNKLKCENDQLVATRTQLSKNISCLFLTSRGEIQRKDKEIEELRDTVKKLQTTSQEKILTHETDKSREVTQASSASREVTQASSASREVTQASSASREVTQASSASTLTNENQNRPCDQPSRIQQTPLAVSMGEGGGGKAVDGEPRSGQARRRVEGDARDVLEARERSKGKSVSGTGSSRTSSSDTRVSPSRSRREVMSIDSSKEDGKRGMSAENADGRMGSSHGRKGQGGHRVSKCPPQDPTDKGHSKSEDNRQSCSKDQEPSKSKPTDSISKKHDSRRNVDGNKEVCQSSKVGSNAMTQCQSRTKTIVDCNVISSQLNGNSDNKLNDKAGDKKTIRMANDRGHCESFSTLKLQQSGDREVRGSVEGEGGNKTTSQQKGDGDKKSKSQSSSLAEVKGESKVIPSDEHGCSGSGIDRGKGVDSNLQNATPQTSIAPQSAESLSLVITPTSDLSQNQPEGIASTSCVVSNQDWSPVMSPSASLPFSKSPDPVLLKEVSSQNTNSQMTTNQTWPFENREATNTCSQSLSSRIDKPVVSTVHDGVSEPLNPPSSEPVRAFPISDLKDGSNSSSCQMIFTNNQDNPMVSAGKLESKSSSTASEEATSSSSGGGGEASSKESSSSKTASNESQKSSSSSLASSNTPIVRKVIDFQSPLKSGFVWNPTASSLEDSMVFTPPKPRNPKQSTPVKLHSTNYDSNALTPSKSDNILCTPNLIVLGDEETTSATLMSPFKSSFVPSEFIPPGVRKEIQEVNTHIRHIRGKPEYLHTSPDVKSQTKETLIPNDLGFQKTKEADQEQEVKDVKVPGKASLPSSSIIKKSVVDRDAVVRDNSNDDDDGGGRPGVVGGDGSGDVRDDDDVHMNDPCVIQPIVTMAFQKVFGRNVSEFKQEMSVKSKSKTNQRVLVSRLKRSAQRMKSHSPPTQCVSQSVDDAPVLSADVRKEGVGDLPSPKADVREESNHKVPRQAAVVGGHDDEGRSHLSSSLATRVGSQKDFVNEWVWYTSFNVRVPRRVKPVSKSKVGSKKESESDEIPSEFSFRGRITKVTDRSPIESQSLPKLKQSPEVVSRTMPVSPTNSCRVTSSCVDFTEQEVRSEKRDSTQANVHGRCSKEVQYSPEPDSTSEPVILKCQESPTVSNSKHDKVEGHSSNAVKVSALVNKKCKDTPTPDSPSKSLAPFASVSKSPSKRASCDVQRRHRSDTTCSGEDPMDKSQVESDLFLSSDDNSEADDEDEKTLNATFIINKDHSDNEFDNGNEEPLPQSSRDDRMGVGGKTPLGGWDEMSLMENDSLSEFDRDVAVLPQQHPHIGTTRMSSRTTSFSSHISVGGFSPFSLASPKLTPSHIRSPKDALWSPLNRTSESRDSCHEDIRTPVSQRVGDLEETRGVMHRSESAVVIAPSGDVGDVQQLSRLFSLQELQQLEMIKSRYRLGSTDSDGSCSDDSGDSSSSGSEDDDAPTPVKRDDRVVYSPARSPLKRLKTNVNSPAKSPLKRLKTIHSPAKSPSRHPKNSRKVRVMQSPRVTKVRSESIHHAQSSEQPVVCRRSPRKKLQSLKPPDNAVKGNVCHREESVSCVRRHSPRKATHRTEKGAELGRKKNCPTLDGQEYELTPSCSQDGLVEDLKFVEKSPQKSVRIVDESSSGENIVTGSVSKESDVILKRSVADPNSGGKQKKSPSLNYTELSRNDTKVTRRQNVGNRRKQEVDLSERAGHSDANSDVSSGSSMERRPLSLQEDNNVDPLLVSRRAEFVHNVSRVTRRLDLDKANKVVRVESDGVDTDSQTGSVDQSPPGRQGERKCVRGDRRERRRTSDTVGSVENEEVANVTRMTDGKGNDVSEDGGMMKVKGNDVSEDGGMMKVKDIAMSEDGGMMKVKDNVMSEDGEVEDGEILDDESDGDNNDDNVQNAHQSEPGVKQHGRVQTTGPVSDRLHITQEGCKVIVSPKVMSRKLGKNFLQGKDSSSHRASPMEKVYTPSSATSSSSRPGARRQRPDVKRLDSDKRRRSKSPLCPALKRPRVDRKDNKPPTRPRSQSPRANNRQRSPDRGGSRNKPSVSHRSGNRSPRRNSRERSPDRSQRQRSPHCEPPRRVSPRKPIRERRNVSPCHAVRRDRDARSGSGEGGSGRDSRNPHHGTSGGGSSSRSVKDRLGTRVDDRQHRSKMDIHHRGSGHSEASRSRSKEGSPPRGHSHHQQSKQSEKTKDGRNVSDRGGGRRGSREEVRVSGRDRRDKH